MVTTSRIADRAEAEILREQAEAKTVGVLGSPQQSDPAVFRNPVGLPADVHGTASAQRPTLPGSLNLGDDPYARARIVSPSLVPQDPARSSGIKQFQALGMIYAPTLGKAVAGGIATALYDWAKDDPDLMALLQEDFRSGVALAQNDWNARTASLGEQFFQEATQTIMEVAGQADRRDNLDALIRKEQAARTAMEAGNPVPWMEVLAQRFDPESKTRFVLNSFADIDTFDFAKVLVRNPMQAGAGLAAAVNMSSDEYESAMAARNQVTFGFGADEIILAVARAIVDQTQATPEQAFGLAQEGWDTQTPESQQTIIEDTKALKGQDILDEYAELTAVKLSRPGMIVDASTMVLAEAMSHFTASTQTIGIQAISGVLNFAANAVGKEVVDLIPEWKSTPLEAGLDSGWTAFRDAYASIKNDGGVAEQYFGLDGATASWVNLAVDLTFDPFNWLMLGGAGATRRLARMMATPEGIDAFLVARQGTRMIHQIAGTTDSVKLAPFLHGLRGPARAALLGETDREVVTAIMRKELTDGFWIPNTGALGKRVRSYQGFGRLAENLNLQSGRGKEWITDFMSRTSDRRAVDLGEANFLDDATDIVLARFRNDPAAAREALDGLYDSYRTYRSGYDEMLNTQVMRAEDFAGRRQALRKTVPPAARRVGGVRQNLARTSDEVVRLENQARNLAESEQRLLAESQSAGFGEAGARSLDEITAELDDIRGQLAATEQPLPTVRKSRDASQTFVDTHGAAYDTYVSELTALRQEATAARRALTMSENRLEQRDILSTWVDTFMDDWGEQIGLPRLKNGRVDWAEFRYAGGQTRVVTVGENVSRGAPFAEAIKRLAPETQGAARQVADELLRSGTMHRLPATPYEMILHEVAGAGGRKILGNRLAQVTGNTLSGIQRIWAVNLLFNPMTAFKAHIEDVIKAFTAAGRDIRPGRAMLSPFRTGGESEGTFAMKQLFGSSTQNYELADAAKNFDGARRWFEGSVLNDDLMKAWGAARAADDPRIFTEFWQAASSQGRRQAQLTASSTGKALSGEEAYRVLGQVVEEWATMAGTGGGVFDDVIKLLARGEKTAPAALIRKLGQVPVLTERTKGLAKGFNAMYGRPGQRRGAVFFDHYYDQAMSIYETRFASRIIDSPDMIGSVSKGLGVSENEARILLAQRHRSVVDWMDRTGAVTRGRLEQQARKWAKEQTEGLLYLSGAESIAGKAGSKVAPFATAQLDFLRFWSRNLFQGTSLATDSRVAGPLLRGISKVAPEAQAATLQKMSKYGTELPIPFNLRVFNKWSTLATEQGRLTENEQHDLSFPTSLVEAFTFFPIGVSDPQNFLSDLSVGLGPIPAWLAHLLPEDDPRYRVLEDLMPSLAWVTESDAGWSEKLAPFIFPRSRRALTTVAGKLARGVGDVGEVNPGNLSLAPIFDLAREPLGFYDQLRPAVGDIYAKDPTANLAVMSKDDVLRAADTARKATGRREALTGLGGWFGVRVPEGFDAVPLRHIEPLAVLAESMSGLGIVGQSQVDDFLKAWAKKDSLTQDSADWLASQTLGFLFDLPRDLQNDFVSQHPEFHTMMRSTVEGRRKPDGTFIGPDNLFFPDGRLNYRDPALQGEVGRKTRSDGFKKGWFQTRPVDEWAVDVQRSKYFALRSSIETHWNRIFKDVPAQSSTGTPGLGWREGSKNWTDRVRGFSVTLTPDQHAFFKSIHVDIEDGSIQYIHDQLSAYLDTQKAPDSLSFTPFTNQISGMPIGAFIDAVAKRNEDEGLTVWDWSEQDKAAVRTEVGKVVAINHDLLPLYLDEYGTSVGALDYQPATPPTFATAKLKINADNFVVTDGDTLALETADGTIRVRIIGINAPEQGQYGYNESSQGFADILAGGRVTLVAPDPTKFPVTQTVDEDGTKRIFAWVYVDGIPLFDPNVFRVTNPTGVETGGSIPDYAGMLER